MFVAFNLWSEAVVSGLTSIYIHTQSSDFLRLRAAILLSVTTIVSAHAVKAQSAFEQAVVDIGNVGVTVTNAGFVGLANVRNAPTGPPSFEFPLDSGIEHLFESGLWVGALRSDGVISVRTGAVTTSGGYAPGLAGYEFAQQSSIFQKSTLPSSDAFTRQAVSHLDLSSTFTDTSRVLPGTSIQMPDPSGRLGIEVLANSYAWNFPFTESFVILNYDIVNVSDQPWDSVYVGMYHDIVTRNINTTTEAGGAFFNKGGYGFIDSLYTSYGFNAGGVEETLNTYGGMAFLGAEWVDPVTNRKRFFHPELANEYIADGYAPPRVIPRWWLFSGGVEEQTRPADDETRYRRMATPFPNPSRFNSEIEFGSAQDAWFERLRTDGTIAVGNWIGLTPIGPFPSVAPGDTLQVTFALVAALKSEDFQGQAGKPVDTAESRSLFTTNILWAKRTYSGEDNNFNGVLDIGEDVNANGVLDRYLIPEPPSSPRLRVEFERTAGASSNESVVALYWDRSSEESKDPVSGLLDFEGYRVYRSNPGDDRRGDIVNQATLIAQYDKPGNETGFNNGFNRVKLSEPVLFDGDTTEYWYRFEASDLKAGWQYLFSVTAIDEGDPTAGLEAFESSRVATAVRVFPGTPPSLSEDTPVGVYPNPYRVNAAWDGNTSRTRKLNFFNLPADSEIRIYTLAGEIVKTLRHQSASYNGDIRWYDDFSSDNRILAGGEHSWDLLSDSGLSVAGGLYLYTVKNFDSGNVQRGKFVIIK